MKNVESYNTSMIMTRGTTLQGIITMMPNISIIVAVSLLMILMIGSDRCEAFPLSHLRPFVVTKRETALSRSGGQPILPAESLRRIIHLRANSEENGSDLDEESNELPSQAKRTSSSSSSSRRDFMTTTSLSAAAMALTGKAPMVLAAEDDSSSLYYKPAPRPTAYRVDSTIPPTLLPLKGARQELQILQGLGRGSGTPKEAVFIDTLNLNNILNKAVFGTINQVATLTGSGSNSDQVPTKGPGYASFVCLGVPMEPSSIDVELAATLLQTMFAARKSSSDSTAALGLACLPYSTQSALDQYTAGSLSELDLLQGLVGAGVSDATLQLYLPLLQLAKSSSSISKIDLLAMAPETQDLEAVRKNGLQSVNPDRRAEYVVDPQGFIALSSDERFKMYSDRSLLKDYDSSKDKSAASSVGNYYAERILCHEAGATAMARYAATRPEALVCMVAPMADVRYLNGINGRIPRIHATLNKESVVTKNAVSTILLNPTALDTLSKSRHLRLEIGTGPETLDYQTKIADYLWFSSSPKVNLIPRLMDG